MILVTVGAQMPFDRLIRAVDAWAQETSSSDVVAQIGPGAWRPSYVRWVEFLSPVEFRDHVERAKLVVAHAGMGTILTALELGKPLLLMPRRGDLRETRNDHQVATSRQLERAGRATIAYDERELVGKLGDLNRMTVPERIDHFASPRLLQAIREFIHGTSAVAAHRAPPVDPAAQGQPTYMARQGP